MCQHNIICMWFLMLHTHYLNIRFTLSLNNASMFQKMCLHCFLNVSKNRALSVAAMFFIHVCNSHCDVTRSNKTSLKHWYNNSLHSGTYIIFGQFYYLYPYSLLSIWIENIILICLGSCSSWYSIKYHNCKRDNIIVTLSYFKTHW